MQLHSAQQLALQVLEVGEVAIHEVVGHLFPFLDPEVQQHVGLEVILIVLRRNLHLEPPLQGLQLGDVLQLISKDGLPELLQAARDFLCIRLATSCRNSRLSLSILMSFRWLTISLALVWYCTSALMAARTIPVILSPSSSSISMNSR